MPENKAAFKLLFEHNPLPMWVYDLETLRFLEVNAAAVAQYGYSRDEFLAMCISDIRPAEDVPRLLAHIARPRPALQSSGEWRHRRKDGQEIDVLVFSHTLEFGGRPAVLVVAQDHTGRKRAEFALEQSERKFRALIEGGLDCIVLIAADRTILYASPSVERVLGYTPEEVVGNKAFAFHHPDDVERIGALHARLLEEPGGKVATEFRLRHKDGTWRWIDAVSTNRLADPSIRAIVGNFRDITERKHAEARYRSLFDGVPAGMYCSTPDGHIVDVNPAFLRMLGYADRKSLESVRAQDLYVDAEVRTRFRARLERDGTVTGFECQLRRSDGSVIWVQTNARAIRDDTGRVTHYEGAIVDITERKQAEARVGVLNELIVAAAQSADLQAFLDTLLDRTLAALGAEQGGIWFGTAHVGRHVSPEFNTEVLAAAAAAGLQPTHVEGIEDWTNPGDAGNAPLAPIMLKHGIRSSLVAPLLVNDRSMGGFSIEMTHPRRWSEQEMQFVDAIGRQVGTVAERLRLIDETRAHAAHMEALHGAGAALRQADSLDALYDVIVEQAIALGRADQASLMLLEADATHFKCIRAHGGATTAQGARFPVAGSIQGMAIQRAEPFVTPDASADHLSSCNGAMEVIGPCVAVPLREGDETIGALLIARRHGTLPGPFVPREVGVLTALAEMASSAIHRAQLYDQMLRRSAQLQALREIDQAITGSLDLHLSLDVVLTKAMTQLQVDAACVLLFNPHLQTLEYAAAQGFRTVVLHHLRINLGEGCAGRAALERRRVGLEDLDMAAYPLALTRVAQGRSEGIKATFATPLIAKGQLLGVLQVFFRRATSPSHDWLAFFDTLAGQSAIAISDARQFQALQRSNDDLVRAYDTTLAGWARALELRDKETRGHTQRVTEMAVRLATQLGVPETQLTHIRRGALLHDIGKMAVSDMVLLKPGPLTSEERVIMERHPVYAYNLLEPIDYLRLSIDIPYCHHEKWDGTGYPRGLKGTDIPLAARIFAVVDVWDALTSERPYRGAWTAERAEKHIKEHAGTHFDPTVVKAFISMLAEERARTPEGNPTPER